MTKKRGRKRKGAAPAPLPGRVGVALLVARLWVGGFFAATALWKLTGGGNPVGENIRLFREGEYASFVENAIRQPPEILGRPLEAYVWLLEHVALPGAGVLAPLVLFFEALLAVGLLLGAGVRLLAGLGVLLMLFFNLGKMDPLVGEDGPVGVFLFSSRTANWPVTVLLFVLCLAAAGRFFGVDAWLRRRAPGWLRWVG